MATKPRKGGGELFYRDENGERRDAELHEEIMGLPPGTLSKRSRDDWLPEKPVTPPKEPGGKPDES
jgi:hypothetical protein